MAYFAGNFKAAFWVAVVPAVVCVLLLVLGVDEPKTQAGTPASDAKRVNLEDVRRLGGRYAIVVSIAAVLTLARFSEAFLILRAQNVGVPTVMAPLVMVVMSVVYAAVAYPAGAAADKGLGPRMLSAGLAALIVADLVLANAGGAAMVYVGAALWGLHMGLTQGLLAALVAASAPADLRGTAFGVFNLVCGIALLVASALAGWLWDTFGPGVTFYVGAAFTLVAWIGLTRFGRGAGELRQA
jgi:MFS family permease